VRDVVRIAVRKRKPNGQWGIAVLISTLLPTEVRELTGVEADQNLDPTGILLAHVRLYDQRGGGVEASFKGDKQGLGLSKRNKKRFEAQQMVTSLCSLAHNVVVWARRWLAAPASLLQHYSPMRMVRDVFQVSGFLVLDTLGRIRQIALNQDAPLGSVLLRPLQTLVAPAHVTIHLAPTETQGNWSPKAFLKPSQPCSVTCTVLSEERFSSQPNWKSRSQRAAPSAPAR
jgi:hypothetical protein